DFISEREHDRGADAEEAEIAPEELLVRRDDAEPEMLAEVVHRTCAGVGIEAGVLRIRQISRSEAALEERAEVAERKREAEERRAEHCGRSAREDPGDAEAWGEDHRVEIEAVAEIDRHHEAGIAAVRGEEDAGGEAPVEAGIVGSDEVAAAG